MLAQVDACVIDKDLDRSERRGGLVAEALDLLLLRHVHGEAEGAAASLSDLALDGLELFAIARD